MRYGNRQDWLDSLEAGRKPGTRIPILDDAPELYSELLLYWEGFWELNHSRPYGESGPLALSFADMKAWCDMFGLSLEEAQLACRYFRAIDREWLDWAAEQAKIERDKALAKTRMRR